MSELSLVSNEPEYALEKTELQYHHDNLSYPDFDLFRRSISRIRAAKIGIIVTNGMTFADLTPNPSLRFSSFRKAISTYFVASAHKSSNAPAWSRFRVSDISRMSDLLQLPAFV